MSLFGKDPEYLEVVAADFLPEGDKLFILVADSDCNLHVLQYDPEGKFFPSHFSFSIPIGHQTNPKQTPNHPTATAS